MVLELLKYAKSAMKNFDQSGASIVVMWLPKEASDWSKFFIADLAYMSNSKYILLANFGQLPFNHLRVLVQRFLKWYDKWRWAQKWDLQGQFKIYLDLNKNFLDFLSPFWRF